MSKPNILFLFSDEHSFRFLGRRPRHEGGEPVHTPTLDWLASNGTDFQNAYCQMPLCTPSRLCMLTGLEAHRAGAWHNGAVVKPELPTMASELSAAGYNTALIGKMHLGGNRQFAGFDQRPYGDLTGRTGHQWEPLQDEDRHGMRQRTSAAGVTGIPESALQEQVTAQETVAFVREHRSSHPDVPWFVLASFSRPHFPLTAPQRWIDYYRRQGITDPYVPAGGDAFDHPMSAGMRDGFRADEISREEMMEARLSYFACVSYLDEVLGDLLTRLEASGDLENTIIVYSTDHGELAGEHGVWWKNGWYEACTHIPLIISTPAQRSGALPSRSEPTPVALVDLFPTFCAAAGHDAPEGLSGVDLGPALTANDGLPDRPVVCDALTPRWGEGMEFRMVRQADYKYVRFRNAPALLFNLAADPGEQRNLAGEAGERSAADEEALRRLEAFANESIDFDAAEESRRADDELRERFKLETGRETLNAYHLPDGRIIDADRHLYVPHLVAERAEEIISDAP